MIPSLADYATHEDSAHPELWLDCVFASCPSLGCTGPGIVDYFSGETSTIANYNQSRWNYSNGLTSVLYTDNASRASAWTRSFKMQSFAVVICLKRDTNAAERTALSIGSTGTLFRFLVSTTGVVSANWSSGSVVTSTTTALNTTDWYHIVAQRSRGNGNLSEIYVNGELEATSTASLSLVNAGANVCIGARRDGTSIVAGTPYAGLIDEVRLYERTLSVTEIKMLANQRAVSFTRR